MKKVLAFVLLFASLGLAGIANAGGGCCAIREPSAAVQVSAASEKVTTLHIEGMTCASCAIAVKRVLKGVEGVKDAQVSYEEKKGVVTYDPAKVTPEKIARAIEKKLPTYKATIIK